MTSFDPTQDVLLDADGLRVLAHPLRIRMLGRLRNYGPATPSMLARDLGESSGATSYHLRQLLAHGFVVEEADRGTKRERWYRSAHRSTHFDMRLDDENRALGAEYLRAVGRNYARRITSYTDSLDEPDAPDQSAWAEVWNLSDTRLDLTVEDAAEVGRELGELLDRWRDRSRPGAPGTGPLVAQFQVLPLPDLP